MSSRRPVSPAIAHSKLGDWAISMFGYALLAMLLGAITCSNFGCASRRNVHSSLDRSAAKLSFLSWNLRSLVTKPRETRQSRAFRIASLSNRELYRLMQTRPAPDLTTISGKWNGINKGVGSAMMGLMQDVKVLEGDQRVCGYNILVKQVAIVDLPCRGWQPVRDPKTCQPKTMGNFVAVAPTYCGKLGHTLKLDYTNAENLWYDPSRFLIDELVQIDNDILLGRATANIGTMHIPVAYFVLTRARECNCTQAEVSSPAYDGLNSIREVVDREVVIDEASVDSEFPSTPSVETPPTADQQDAEKSASDKPIVFDAREAMLID